MKVTSEFFRNCVGTPPMMMALRLIKTISLACLLLFLACQYLPSMVLAQSSPAPNTAATAPVDSTQAGTTGQTERISIRIEFPLVEPMFDIFYPREEPRIEADAIAPIANPLLELPPTPEKLSQEEHQANRIAKPQILLDRLRE